MAVDLVSEEEAELILKPYLVKIAKIVQTGWGTWGKLQAAYPNVAAEQGRRTRASWVSDAMAAEARRQFDHDPNVHISNQRGFLTLTFATKIVLRFKKFSGSKLRTTGLDTRQRKMFEQQQLVLDGMQISSVVAGYLLDALEQGIARAAIVCPLSGQNEWVIDLELPGERLAPIVPVGPVGPQAQTLGVVVESTIVADEDEAEV